MTFLAALGVTAANFAGSWAWRAFGIAVAWLAAIVTTGRILPATYLPAGPMIDPSNFATLFFLTLVASTSTGMATWLRIEAHLATFVPLCRDVGVTEDLNPMATAGNFLTRLLLAEDIGQILCLPARR